MGDAGRPATEDRVGRAQGRIGEPAPTDPLAVVRDLAARVQRRCVSTGLSLVTAESCTGGLIGHAITEHPGSSAYYAGGAVAYSDAAKSDLLDVPQATLRAHGAVSAQVAAAMAEGARRRLGADLAVAVTGIAGPDGGSDAKPVGLTYVAVAGVAGNEVRRHVWHGDRADNKVRSAEAALRLLLDRLGEGTEA
ncbi:MAG TPA: CinA family protein [Candidatus Acidoferrales bacterium]|nr:CinA family protein [Candidatus Acidoferrales bacterium]